MRHARLPLATLSGVALRSCFNNGRVNQSVIVVTAESLSRPIEQMQLQGIAWQVRQPPADTARRNTRNIQVGPCVDKNIDPRARQTADTLEASEEKLNRRPRVHVMLQKGTILVAPRLMTTSVI